MKTYTLYETSSEKSVTGNREQIARELIADLWADGSRAETFGTLEEAIDRAKELNLTQTHAREFVGDGSVPYVRLDGACIDEEDEETGAIETVLYSDDDRAKEWLSAWAHRGYQNSRNGRSARLPEIVYRH